ncbi:Glutathione S-transferase omega-1, partial [Coemansia sp. S680]
MSATTYPFKENAYTLYSYALCPYAQRAVRAFNIAKVPYVVEEIDLKNKPDWYHLVNPQLKVPALRTPDGTILIESL